MPRHILFHDGSDELHQGKSTRKVPEEYKFHWTQYTYKASLKTDLDVCRVVLPSRFTVEYLPFRSTVLSGILQEGRPSLL